MKKRCCFFILWCFAAASVFTQTRGNVLVFIEAVADSYEHAAFFKDNFEMEAIAAGYTTAGNRAEADYILRLKVDPNMITYDDGTTELAPPDENQFFIFISIIKSEDNSEVISFSFPFSDLSEMYEYNLFLLYQAMANIPLTKDEGGEQAEATVTERTVIVRGDESDAWRNKWMYIRASLDYQITLHELKGNGLLANGTSGSNINYLSLDHSIRALPGATVGLELQFLYWLSTELDLRLGFGDPVGNTFFPGLQWGLKFPIKPGRHLMIEPYIAATFLMDTSTHYIKFPYIGVGGGAQFAVKGGENGAFFFALNYVHTIGEVVTKNTNGTYPYPSEIHWNRYAIIFSFGYKIGLFDRARK